MPNRDNITLADVYRRIGSLEAKIDGQAEQQSRDVAHAERSRAAMHSRLDAQAKDIAGLTSDVKDVTEVVEEIKPFVDRAKKWEHRGWGALAAAGMIMSGLTAGFIWLIANWRNIRDIITGN